jgi:hypothetical protein
MTTPNRSGPDGTLAALLASNPAHAAPSAADRLDAHSAILADHDNRITALEKSAPHAPAADVLSGGGDS